MFQGQGAGGYPSLETVVSNCLRTTTQNQSSPFFMTILRQFQQRMHMWWPAAAVLAVGGVLSVGLWQVLQAQQTQTVQTRLEQQAQLFTASIEQRMYAYSDLVEGVRPLMENAGMSAKEAFSALKMTQDFAVRYPGAETLSHVLLVNAAEYEHYKQQFLHAVPNEQRVHEALMPRVNGEQSWAYVIDEVWPIGSRPFLKGFDIGQFPAVRSLVQRSIQSDVPVMSAPFPLVQTSKGKTGVVLSVPLKKIVKADQEKRIDGFLNLSINIERMMQHLVARGMLSHTALAIHDHGLRRNNLLEQSGDAPIHGWPVFASHDWGSAAHHSSLRTQRELHIGGRVWMLEYAPQASVLSRIERYFPFIIALSTFGASVLLAIVVTLLNLKRARAQLTVQAKQHLLQQRTERLNALFHQSAFGVAEMEPATGRYISANTRLLDVIGVGLEELLSQDIYEVVHAEDREDCRRMMQRLCSGEVPHFSVTHRIVRGDGGIIWCEAWVAPLHVGDGKPSERHILLLQDVTERRLMQEQLKAREAYSSEMLRYMPVGLVVVGSLGDIEFVNHQFENMTGWSQQDLSDETGMWRLLCADVQQHNELLKRLNAGRCEVVASGVNMPAMEYLLRSKDGRQLAMEVSGRFLGGRILLSFVDVTQRKAAEEEIRWLGQYDTLTQLPNRRLLLDRLEEALARSQRPNACKGALLLLDLDNFKALNETLGHELGDDLLRLVATRLSHCISGRHTLARQGGDEFAVVLEDLPENALEAGRHTEQVGRSILQALRAPFYLDNQDLHVTVSMGAVVFPGQADTVEELLKRADLALYQAKNAGRDTLQFFDPRLQQAVSTRVEMEKGLRQALDRHEFDLFFQAQVQGAQVTGAEALLRWNHPTKGFISPGVFVPAAEESGLILPLGEWVLYAACRQLAHWARDPLMAGVSMSVNVSARQFHQPNFVDQVKQALQVTGAQPQLLDLELTEGILLTDVEDTIEKMVQLKGIGVRFSLDDFGTGYSSLSYLKRLPLDKLKIDQSFVREVVTSANDAAITRSIIALGHSLGLKVIAEGVETQEQKEFLAENGCNYCQGYFFNQPQPGPAFEAWVRAFTSGQQVKTPALQ